MNMRASRKGLSPLLAIIIGLVVTVVAGILLAQLYFSYAATISARPAANVEYVDLVTDGTNSYLVINIKNIGNVPITAVKVSDVDCGITNVAPGGTASCTLDNTIVPTYYCWNCLVRFCQYHYRPKYTDLRNLSKGSKRLKS
jgi:hypothetical protein